MRHGNLSGFLRQKPVLKGPIALILAEDLVEMHSTVAHHIGCGFRSVLLLLPAGLISGQQIFTDAKVPVHIIDYDPNLPDPMPTAVNAVIATAPGRWIYAGYNAEYLFYPFSETRSVVELLTFHTEERRTAMLTSVIDLYAADLTAHPNAVSRDEAYLDAQGYYALARQDEAAGWAAQDRQLDIYGGLRRRFEEHVPWTRRRIDRIALFQAKPGLRMLPDFTLNEPEMNTYASPWHHNLTAAVCSFRTAKALRTNPGSRDAIPGFVWQHSTPFQWRAQQLMDLGLIEPGQWF